MEVDNAMDANTNTSLQACRACMGKENDLKPLFMEMKSSHPSLSDMFLYVTGLKVDENDGLPNYICSKCVLMARSALQFKEMCYQSDTNFRRSLLSHNTLMSIKKEYESFAQSDLNTINFVTINNKENVQQIGQDIQHETVKPVNLVSKELYQCALCSKSFKLCNKLKDHVKTCHLEKSDVDPSDTMKYSCSKCSKTFRSKRGHTSHYKKCQSKEDTKNSVKEEIISDSDSDTPLSEKFETRQTQNFPLITKCDDILNTSIPEKFDNDDTSKDILPCDTYHSQDEDDGNFFDMSNYGDTDVKMESVELIKEVTKPRKKAVEKKYSCDECSLTLTKELYDAHMKTVHTDEKKATKRRARKVLNGDIADLVVNGAKTVELMIPEPTFKCTQCERKFLKETSLQAHIKKHESQMNEVHKCDICKREFKRRAHLENHMLTHAIDKGFKCSMCPKAFTRQDSLAIHLANHRGVKKHQCNFCEKGFNMLSTLKDHIRTHTGEKPFLCSICGRGFSQSTNLKEHVRRHQGYKPFKCNFCSQTFVSKGELEAHTRKHSGAHPFVCDECGGGFTTSSSLVKHKRIHSGERPYQCDFCPMKFTALGTLKNHRRTHTGEKPYKCQYCDKAFAQKNDLVSHTRTHTGERPYICSVCGHAFRQSSALKTHFKIHGGQGDAIAMDAESMKLAVHMGVGSAKLGEAMEVATIKLVQQLDMENRSSMDDSSSSMNLVTPKIENQ